MENYTDKKKSKTVPAMAVVSVVIIVLGILCAFAFYSTLTNEIAQGAGEQLVVEGTDIVPIVGNAGKAGAAVLSGLIVAGSFVLVAFQWIGYVLVRIIKGLFTKVSTVNTDNY